MQVLVLEASTTSAKAMCYDSQLGVVQVQGQPYGEQVNKDGEHDVDGVFAALVKIGAEVAQGRDIDAVALVGTWHNMMLCDTHARPITPAFTWVSTLGNHITRKIRGDHGLTRKIFESTGCMVNSTYPLYKLMHLYESGMEVGNCLVMGENPQFFYRLTGELATSRCSASGSGFLNIQTLDWSDIALELAHVKKSQFPAFTDDFGCAPLTEEAARLLGLRPGIPVVVGQADGAMNQLGAGALRKGCMTFSMGTSAAVRMATEHSDLSNAMGTWCYYAPTTRLCGAATAGATSCVDWFMDTMAGGKGYAELAAGLEIEKDAPYFMPFLYGERCPGWNDTRTGGFSGILGKHTVKHMYAAILEGTLFNIYQSYLCLEAFSGKPQEILISGGIVNSEEWLQMAADLWQREMKVQNTAQASMLGGTIMALKVLGEVQDITQTGAVGEIIRTVVPRPEMTERYQSRYEGYLKRYAVGES